MLLQQLLHRQEFTMAGGGAQLGDYQNPDITALCYDSRAVTPGALFCCLPGVRVDGHDYAAEAVAAGAVAVLGQRRPAGLAANIPVILVPEPRRTLALLACRFYGEPAARMTMIGVTGTKGKTTTSHLIAAILTAAGHTVGLLGTNGVRWPGCRQDLNHTTPESCELQALLREMADAGCDTCVMEVSSQGLKKDRVAGIFYDVGVFTNLTPDHIAPGEHTSYAEYRAWKAELFRRCKIGVLNADDADTPLLLTRSCCRRVYFGMGANADYHPADTPQLLRSASALGVCFTLQTPSGAQAVTLHMPGQFSVYNALAAAAVAGALGVPLSAIAAGLQSAVVKGRVEVLPLHADFTLLIDYAHNEAAAQNLLNTLRAYRPARLVVLFGCGGNRSRLRRYGMGEICARLADVCIVTEDNNRFEEVENILADIRVGIAQGAKANPGVVVQEIPDRLDALHYAVDQARPGDIIAVIGKGHETYRDRRGVKTPFAERDILEHCAAAKGLL